MRSTKLHPFIDKVMTLSAGFPGMGGAQAGIIGSRSTETDVVSELRRNALEFAAEYRNVHANRTTLRERARNLEGSLRGLCAISAISEATLHTLLKELNHLVEPSKPRHA